MGSWLGDAQLLLKFRALGVPEARDEVIVDHARRLHEGVERRRSDKAKAVGLEGFAHSLRYVGLGLDVFGGGERVDDRPPVNKTPYILSKWHAFANFEIDLRIGDRCFDLGAVTDDAFVLEEAIDVSR